MPQRLVILGWHNVEGSWCFPAAPGHGVRGLGRQLRLLQRVAHVVDLGQALRDLEQQRPLPPRAVAITFDDGYRDNLELAVPMLEGLGLPATFFLAPGLLSHSTPPWWELLAWAFARSRRRSIAWNDTTYQLDGGDRGSAAAAVSEQLKGYDQGARLAIVAELVELLDAAGSWHNADLMLDWDGARQLVRRGFAVGSHSMDHAILNRELPADQEDNLSGSRRLLESQLGVPVETLAYPNGTRRDFDATTIRSAQMAGYRFALTTIVSWNTPQTPPYELRRSVMYPERGTLGYGIVAAEHAGHLVRSSPGR